MPPEQASPEPSSTTAAQPPAEVPSAKLDKTKTLIGGLLTLAVLAIVIAVVIPKFGGFHDAWAYIQAMPLIWVGALIAAIALNLAIFVLPYQAAIPGLGYRPGFVVRQTSFAISNGVPLGGAFGLAVQYPMLLSYGTSAQAATAGIGVTSVWSLFMTLGIPVLGVLGLVIWGESVQSTWLITAGVGIAAIAATLLVFWLILRSEASARKIAGFAQKLADPLMRRFNRHIDLTAQVLHFRDQIVDLVVQRWKWITVSNLMVIVAQFLILFVAIKSVGRQQSDGLTLAEAFAAFAISRMATMIPIPPGGLGTVDAALIALLVGFGLPESVAVAAALVSRACSFMPQVALGIGTFLYWRVHQARSGAL
ncbi:MAG: lysylphosphatidylglycerol synthase transmembrane domain-containing protein [Candidatus Nanopelagicales bacterium]